MGVAKTFRTFFRLKYVEVKETTYKIKVLLKTTNVARNLKTIWEFQITKAGF